MKMTANIYMITILKRATKGANTMRKLLRFYWLKFQARNHSICFKHSIDLTNYKAGVSIFGGCLLCIDARSSKADAERAKILAAIKEVNK